MTCHINAVMKTFNNGLHGFTFFLM